MNTTIQIGSRGTMTLPKPLRKALGVERGGVLIASADANGIVLHPAVAFPIELYTDKRIAEFDETDAQLERHVARKRA